MKKMKSKEQKEKEQYNQLLREKNIQVSPTNRWMLRILIALGSALNNLGTNQAVILFDEVMKQTYGFDKQGRSKWETVTHFAKQGELKALSKRAGRFKDFAFRFFPDYQLSLMPVMTINGEREIGKPYIAFALHQGPNGKELQDYVDLQHKIIAGLSTSLDGLVELANNNGALSDSTRKALGLPSVPELAERVAA